MEISDECAEYYRTPATGGESEEDQDSEEISRRSTRECTESSEQEPAEGAHVRCTAPSTGNGSRHQQPPDDVTATAAVPNRTTGHVVDYPIIHPSQTRFACPDSTCRLTYPSHSSLIRHVGVSHKRLTLNISFKCAQCEYTHANKKSTSLHFRHAHGVAVPPTLVEGSNEKACPYCPLTFPSTNSCSKHIREKHMAEMCAQRAREAAEKEVEPGTSTARTKWSQREIDLFKGALTKYGPDSNIKLANEIRTRTAAQVNVYKWRFLKAYPSWLSEHFHPTPPTGNTPNSPRASSTTPHSSPSQPPEDRSPPPPRGTQPPRPATTRVPKRPARGRLPATPAVPPPSQSATSPSGTQLAARTPTPTSPAGSEVGVARQSPSNDTATPVAQLAIDSPRSAPRLSPDKEERTPSPPPVPLSKEGAAKVQRLDQLMRALRTCTPVVPTPPLADLPIEIPESQGEQLLLSTPFTPPPAELSTPPCNPPRATEEGAPLLSPANVSGGVTQGLHNEALDIPVSGGIVIAPWEPCFPPPHTDLITPTPTPPLATVSERQHCSPGVGVASHLQSPPATTLPASATIPPLALAAERQYHRPEVGVDLLMLSSPSALEVIPVPPPAPSIFQSLLHVPPFIPAAERAPTMVQRLDQALQSLRGGEAPDTSPSPTPPSSPMHAPPPAMVPARQHCSLEVGVVSSQLPITSPAAEGPANPAPPSSPGQPRAARVPGQLARINIDPENMDLTLRLPFHNELLPFAGRTLGEFEWVAFESTLERWTTAIKEVVTAQSHHPSHATSQWACRRRRRQAENPSQPRSPPPASAPPDEPSQSAGPRGQGAPNNRASGRARHAARARALQRLYRANPGACMRQLLDNGPPVYCKIAEPEIVGHFTTAYAESPPLGPPPAWLFPDRHPGDTGVSGTTDEGDVLQSPVTPQEVVTQFRRTKRTSPGSDGITYASWRWVDPKGLILATIFNICRINSRVPRPWKHSTVTLIHKGGDTANIRNWRPISLQLTVYKLYSAIIARRIASWAIGCSAFSPAQKGFLAFDGCAEHNFLLRSILTDSRRSKNNVLLTWLDLREAFPSVSHELMLLLMGRLGLSGSVLQIVGDIYTNSTMSVRTGKESFTPRIPQKRGVKQGCPLSPILFNIVLEGLLRHLSTNKAGYLIAGHTINSLAYADDVCVVASDKTELQGLLDQCEEFATWAQFVFNTKKCGSLCLFNKGSPIYVDHLFTPHLGAEVIPALTWSDRYKYLGCPTGAYRTPANVLNELRDSLLRDSEIVFSSLLAEWQKLDAFRRFLFPRLCFALKVIFPGVIWCRKLDTSIRTIIKRGLRLPQRTCTKYLYLSQRLGGMGIPCAEDESHVARAAQAFKFLGDTRDPRIRDVALHQLGETMRKRARHLDPSKREDMAEFLNSTAQQGEGRAGDVQSLWSVARASLANGRALVELTEDSAILHTVHHDISWLKRNQACQWLREDFHARHLSAIKRSSDQGRAFDSLSLHPDSTFFTYTGKFLSFYQYRFIHKARLNLLPVRTVQARCRKLVPSTKCRLCGREEETLAHVVNHCHHNLLMVRDRHNAILDRIVRAIPDHLGTKMKEQPLPGTSGANRPDLTIISPDETSILLVEVSCPFEGSPTALEDAARIKIEKYEPLRQTLLQKYTSVEVLPFIVGALGSWYPPNNHVLSRLHIGWRYASLMRRLCVVSAISGTQAIWYNSMCTQRRGPPPDDDPVAPQVAVTTDGNISAGASGDGIVGPQGETPPADGGGTFDSTGGIVPANV